MHGKAKLRARTTEPTGCGAPSIFIVSDIRLVRDGLVWQLERDRRLNVLGGGPASAVTLEQLKARPASAVALDLSAVDGFAFAKQLRLTLPAVKVVGFPIGDCDPHLAEWACLGICGYVEREGTAEDIVVTVLHALKGELYCSPRFAAHMLTEIAARGMTSGPAPGAIMASLTPREAQILQEIRIGASNKEIARQLGISAATVKNHVHHLLEKLSVRRRAQASAMLSGITPFS